ADGENAVVDKPRILGGNLLKEGVNREHAVSDAESCCLLRDTAVFSNEDIDVLDEQFVEDARVSSIIDRPVDFDAERLDFSRQRCRRLDRAIRGKLRSERASDTLVFVPLDLLDACRMNPLLDVETVEPVEQRADV